MRIKSKEDRTSPGSAELNEAEFTIPVIAEEAVIGKKVVSKGGISIRKEVLSEETTVDVPVDTEYIDIERMPVNEYRESRPEIRNEGDTMIIPVLKEVIEKRLLLVEEIRITKRVTRETRQEKITLKNEKVTIREKKENKDSKT